MDPKPTGAKPKQKKSNRTPKEYELYEHGDAGAGLPAWKEIETDRPIKGKVDGANYCKSKNLTGTFRVKADLGEFKVGEQKPKLKVTML